MAWALQFDGINDRADFSEITLSGDFTIVFTGVRFESLSSNHFIIGHSSITSSWVGKFNNSFRARINGQDAILPTPPSTGIDYDITVSRVGTTVTISEPTLGSGTAFNGTDAVFNQLGRFQTRDDWLFDGRVQIVSVTNSTVNRNWDASASSHAAGTPLIPVCLTDTIGGNNATGVNMPTDGSAWVDLGGGNVLSADIGTYAYTGTNAELVRDKILTVSSGTYNYIGSIIGLLKGLELSADSGAYTYTGADVALIYTPAGSFILNADSGNYSYTGQDINFNRDRVIIASSGVYTYNGTEVQIILPGQIWTDKPSALTNWTNQTKVTTIWTDK